MADCLYLVKGGVPFETAFGLDEAERIAFVVVLGTLEGLAFDWRRFEWRDRRGE